MRLSRNLNSKSFGSFVEVLRVEQKQKGEEKMEKQLRLLIVGITLVLSNQLWAKIIYVDVNAPGADDGKNWTDAYIDLQSALGAAQSGDEIWVAEGIYMPTQDMDRTKSFLMRDDVSMYGGFTTGSENSLEQRDFIANETILSGDIGDPNNDSDNSYHVVTGANNATLDGFIITGGNANGSSLINQGGGMLNYQCHPTVANCVFNENLAPAGGGMANMYSSTVVTYCTFINNLSSVGAGMNNHHAETVIVTDCTFQDNSATQHGGAMQNARFSQEVTNCIFTNNTAGDYGGGISNGHSNSTYSNCTFNGNSASYGGAMSSAGGNSTVTNCIFSDNTAAYGGALHIGGSKTVINCTLVNNLANYNGGGIYNLLSTTNLINCILWDNNAINGPEIYNHDGSVLVSYSNIQNGWEGENNIDADPNFVDPNNDNYHLQSQAGHWDKSTHSWIKDNITSPCIDTGDPMSLIGKEQFPNGGRVNMGAYGGTAKASKSYFGEPVCEDAIAGDVDGDCRVGFRDFAIMSFHWLEENKP